MTVELALEGLFIAVRDRFIAEGTNAANFFGWKEAAQQSTANRITWKPGDPNGKAGQSLPAKYPGRNPRPLGTLRELFTVEIAAQDPAEPEVELAQYRVVRLLRDAWERAVYYAAHGTFRIESQEWIEPKRNERRFGAAMRIVCSIDAMVPDRALTGLPEHAKADVTIETLDVTDTQTIEADET